MDKYSAIIDAIRNVHSASDCSVIKVPSYLKKITATKDTLVLLLFKNAAPIDLSNLSLGSIEAEVEDSLDLTGSPLKDECPIAALDISADLRDLKEVKNWEAAEENYRGISYKTVINIFNGLTQDFSKGSDTSIWGLCSGDTGKILFLQKEFVKGWNSRGKIWCEGQIPLQDLNLAALRRAHAQFAGADEKIHTEVQSQFKLKSNIIIEHSWINSSETTLVNTSNSSCHLHQVLPVDSGDFSAEHHWRQLVILDMIAKEIIKYKMHDDKRIDPVYECGNDTTTVNLLKEQIRTCLTELPIKMTDLQTTAQTGVSSVVRSTNERDCLSITDKLWDILKFCATYKDLKIAFNFIFHCASDNRIVNTQANSNHLAMMIDAIAHRELTIPCLLGSEPLELLLEIGIEKARKDYEFIFSNSKICFPEDLQLQADQTLENQPYSKRLTSRKSLFSANHAKSSRTLSAKSLLKNPTARDSLGDSMGFRNSNFNRGEVEYRLAKLAQIHLILEHLLLVESLKLTNLNQMITRNLLECPLVAFKDINLTEHYTLNISVPNNQVEDLMKSKGPNSLRIVMRSVNKFKQVENTFYYTSEAIIPPETFPMNTENLSKVEDDIDQDLYLMYRYLKIRTLGRTESSQ